MGWVGRELKAHLVLLTWLLSVFSGAIPISREFHELRIYPTAAAQGFPWAGLGFCFTLPVTLAWDRPCEQHTTGRRIYSKRVGLKE